MKKIIRFKEGQNVVYNEEIPYSTKEIRVGTWMDGKPIYRKVVAHGMALEPGDNVINVSTPNLETVTYHYLTKPWSAGYVLPWQGANGKLTYVSQIKSDKIIITAGEGWNFAPWRVVIEYTKTTD